MFNCQDSPSHGRQKASSDASVQADPGPWPTSVLVRSLLRLVRHGGLLPACCGERGPATAAAAAPAASWHSNAAKFTARAAERLPCAPSPELHGVAAESH